MDTKSIKILLVEDNPGDARLLKEYLSLASSVRFEISYAGKISEALQKVGETHFDIILLDLMLPDSTGLETFHKIKGAAGGIPVVVMSGVSDETTAIQAVQEGAQDYLVKGQVEGHLLVRALRYAIERNRMQIALRSQSLVDDLSGLYNRRGFMSLAQQQIKLSRRTRRGFFIVFVDLDGLKKINDTYGHLEGDRALVTVANILKKTFRETDIVARIGGDEFIVLAIDAADDTAEIIRNRTEENIKEHNAAAGSMYQLSVSMGIVSFNSSSGPVTLNQLMEQADQALYKHKRSKRE
ncbi:MAG: GGDEF domain-containing response regulator [Candidatus Omnitrophota bacterium]|jgi:diguanylate cyclase (GGDEF)-like protein